MLLSKQKIEEIGKKGNGVVQIPVEGFTSNVLCVTIYRLLDKPKWVFQVKFNSPITLSVSSLSDNHYKLLSMFNHCCHQLDELKTLEADLEKLYKDNRCS